MKLSSIMLAAAVALAGTTAFADTTVNRTVQVGPNGEVTHVVKQTVNPDGSTRTVHRTRRVTTVTTPVAPVVIHRKVVYHSPEWRRHHRHVVYVAPKHDRRDHVNYRHHDDKYSFTRHGEVHYANSVRPRHNNS
jgi:hypothetical protein